MLFILNDWQCKAAHVSCTGFSPKASELYSAIMRIDFDLGSYYNPEHCTARFTDNFGITKHLITLHNLTKNLHLNTEKPKLHKTHQKDKPTTALDVKSKTMHLQQV